MNRTAKFLTIAAALSLVLVSTGCSKEESGSPDIVYEDMQASFEQSGLLSANIGLISKTVDGENITYGEFGSGVIFEKADDAYYALTAAHVVSNDKAQLLVFTVNTRMENEDIPGLDNMNVLKPEVYDTMYKAETVFVSDRDDLAVIRFACDEDLAQVEIAENDPAIDDRIMCIGNPQNDWFAVSYGKITSGIENFGEFTGFVSHAMKHSAYMHVGSSGGAALNEEMKLAGITPGGNFSADGKDFKYGVMTPVSEINACLAEWNR